MDRRFNIPRVAEGLTAHAIERQHGFERHQRPGSPTWAEQRRLWTDAILQGMARLDGKTSDPTLMERFDQELEQTRGCYFLSLPPVKRRRTRSGNCGASCPRWRPPATTGGGRSM